MDRNKPGKVGQWSMDRNKPGKVGQWSMDRNKPGKVGQWSMDMKKKEWSWPLREVTKEKVKTLIQILSNTLSNNQ